MKTLFDPDPLPTPFDAPPFAPGSPTSQAAAEQIEPAAGTLRARVLEFIRSSKGATDEEIQLSLGMSPNTERPRRIELVNAGLVADSKRTRKTLSGREAVVWVATGSR